MADLVKIAPGVVRSFDGKRAIYTGTAEALIAAGLLDEHQIPGQSGMARGMCTVGTTQIIAKPMPRGTRYEVRVLLSAERAASLRLVPRQREDLVPLAPAASRVWPFPVSVGHQRMEARA